MGVVIMTTLHLKLLKMAKKITEEGVIKEKLEVYLSQKEEVEKLIDRYIELYNRLDGAIEATRDILRELQEKKSTTTSDSLE